MSPVIGIISMEQGMDWPMVHNTDNCLPAMDLAEPQSFPSTRVNQQLGFERRFGGEILDEQKSCSYSSPPCYCW